MAGEDERARSGLTRAFDMLTDARHHFYGVDFYLIDVTLLAETTLGESLRNKLASGSFDEFVGVGITPRANGGVGECDACRIEKCD